MVGGACGIAATAGISVLSGTRRGYELDAGPVGAVIDAGRRGESPWSAIFHVV